MTTQLQNSTLGIIRAPLIDKSGLPVRAFSNWLQKIETKTNAALSLLGINPETPIVGTSKTIGGVTQNLAADGTLPTGALTGSVGEQQVGFTLDAVPDGATRFAVKNGAGLEGVAQVDAAKLAIIDFLSAHLNKILDNIGDGVTYQRFSRIASGQTALGTSLIAGGGNNVVTVSAPGALATDTPAWGFSGAPAAAYLNGSIIVLVYLTAGNINFAQVNPTAGNVTPAAQSVNWQIVR